MENEQTGMSSSLFSVLIKSSHEDIEWQNRQQPGDAIFSKTLGFVRIDKLHLLTAEDDNTIIEMNVDQDKVNREQATPWKLLVLDTLDISEIEKRIIESYFIQNKKPSAISRIVRQPRSRIYTTVESIKRTLIKSMKERDSKVLHKQRLTEEVKDVIRSYCKQKESRYFTVEDVKQNVDTNFRQNVVVSYSTIRRFMRKNLKLRYKRISTRPPVVLTPVIVDKQKSFWKFYRMWKQQNFKIIQVDEFTVGRGTFVNMTWSKLGESGYAIQPPTASRFSVIAAIWDSNLELVAISQINTNGKIFVEFMKILNAEIEQRYRELKDKIVITFDGARYHEVKDVEEFCKTMDLMVVQTPPYTPQFSPVELFINCVKSKIRMKLRKSK